MTARFLIVNNGMTEARGHYAETGVAIAQAARVRGFDVLMGVHARCRCEAVPEDLLTLPLFRVDHWGHIVDERLPSAVPLLEQLRPLQDTSIEAVRDGRLPLRDFLNGRFAKDEGSANRGWRQQLVRLLTRSLPPLCMASALRLARLARGLVPPIAFDWLRALSRRGRGLPPVPWAEGDEKTAWLDREALPADVDGLLRRALGRIPPDHNEFTHYQMFAADLERFLALCEAGPGDHVYFPTAYGRDAAAVLSLVQRVGADNLPTFHLEYRHAVLSPMELERETCAFRAFHTRSLRAYFDACRAYPESSRVRFYTDTPELAADYAALAGFRFRVLPIPFRAELIPQTPPRDKGSPLRVLFLGDLREEKGFTKLPALIREFHAHPHGIQVQFVIPGRLHPEECEPNMLAALAELEQFPEELVERPYRDGFIPPEMYYRVLSSSDVVLCPYDPAAYRSRSSGVFAEAVAAGKPAIVPADTWMSACLEPGAGEAYTSERELVRALRRVCSDYPTYRQAAAAVRDRWLACHSPDNLVACLLSGRVESNITQRVMPVRVGV